MAMSQNSNTNDNLLRWNRFKPSEMSHSVRITNAMEDFVLDRQLNLLRKEQQAFLLRSEEDRRYLVARAHNNHYLRKKNHRKSHFDIHADAKDEVKLPKLKSKTNHGGKNSKSKNGNDGVYLPQLEDDTEDQLAEDTASQTSESSSAKMRRWRVRSNKKSVQHNDNTMQSNDRDTSDHPRHDVELMHPPISTNMEIRRQSLAFNRVEVEPDRIILPTNRRQKHMMTSDLSTRRSSLLPLLNEIEKQNLERLHNSVHARQNQENDGFASKIDELFPQLKQEDESRDRRTNIVINSEHANTIAGNDANKDIHRKQLSAFQSQALRQRLHHQRKPHFEDQNLPKLYEEIRNCNYIRHFRTGHRYRPRKRQTQWLKY